MDKATLTKIENLYRRKQFAILYAATKTRFETGVNLKGQKPNGKFEAEKPNAMCSQKLILLTSV